ncbi:MAG TPA: lysylphosphatidylglycerol synthase transmembrane domain-containing protein [Chloroflexota bacterium]|nr:lysylphosphatidylglycerol synthase transmembrane domain-containing protein [Chloroflexota bacterium]
MTRRRLATAIQLVIGFAVSGVCLVLAFQNVHLEELADALSRTNYWWLGPAALGQLIALFARARRWQVLLMNRAGFGELFWAQAIGFLGTNLFPLRAGEAARVLVASRQTGLPLVQVGVSAVVERALDVATILCLLGSLLPLIHVPSAVLAAALPLGAALIAVALITLTLLLLGQRGEAAVGKLAGWLAGSRQRALAARWRELMVGFHALRQPVAFAEALGWSALTWAVSVATYWATIEAVVPGSSFVEPAFAVAVLSIGISVPSSPGFVGVFQLVGQQALAVPFPDRYTLTSALTIAILANGVYYVLTTGVGMVGLLRLGLSLRAVRASSQIGAGGPAEAQASPSSG